jgi:hypothetical protein
MLKPLSLYPLKFEEVIADVLKVKPEMKHHKAKKRRQASRKKRGNNN